MRSRFHAQPVDLDAFVTRLFAAQTRAVARIGGLPGLNRVPRARLTLLTQTVALIALLALGTAINAILVWALLAVPMTLIVALFLAEPELRLMGARAVSPRPQTMRPSARRCARARRPRHRRWAGRPRRDRS